MDERPEKIQPYAWVVLAAGFLSCGFSFGGAKAFGVFYVEFLEKYGEGSGSTAWIASVSMALLLGCGLPSSWLCDMFSARVVIVTGGLITALGHVISSFVTRMEWLYLTYGVLTGIGRGLCFTPSLLMVNTYFVQRRAFANGVFAAGSGVGSFVLPFITRVLLDNYGLDGALLMFTGITLNACVCGALMRPFIRVKRSATGKAHPGIQVGSTMEKLLSSEDPQHFPIASMTSNTIQVSEIGKDEPATSFVKVPHTRCYGQTPAKSLVSDSVETAGCFGGPPCPVPKEIVCNDYHDDGLRESSNLDTSYDESVKDSFSETDPDITKVCPNMSSLAEEHISENPPVSIPTCTQFTDDTSQQDSFELGMKHTVKNSPSSNYKSNAFLDTQSTKSNSGTSRDSEESESFPSVTASKEVIVLDPSINDFAAPLFDNTQDRKTHRRKKQYGLEEVVVLLNKNLTLNPPNYSEQNVVIERYEVIPHEIGSKENRPNTRLPSNGANSSKKNSTVTETESQKRESQNVIISWFHRLKTPSLDLRILNYPVFMMYEVAFMLATAGYLNNFIMLPAHAVHIGFTKPQADLLVSFVGIADIFGRIFFGWFSDLGLISRGNLASLLAFIGAIPAILIPLSRNYTALCAYSVSVGLIAGVSGVIIFVLIAESFGKRLTPNVFGVHSTVFAIPALLGPPVTGWLRDWTGSWDMSFRLGAICLLLAMLITLGAGQYVVRKVTTNGKER